MGEAKILLFALLNFIRINQRLAVLVILQGDPAVT